MENPVQKSKIEENIRCIEEEISKLSSDKKTKIVREHIEQLSNGEGQVC